MIPTFITLLLFNLTAVSQPTPSTASCTQQLKNHNWPIDCLIGLKAIKASLKSEAYKNLNKWCLIKSEILSQKEVPGFFLSLNPPRNCKMAAQSKLRLDRATKLLEGTFLNSFP